MVSPDDPGARGFPNYAPWINVVFGLVVFALRYAAPRGTFSVHWNLFLTGIAIMFAALATTISHGNTSRNYWSAINVAAGVWLLISAFTIPSVPRVTVSQVVLGALIVVLAIASLVSEMISARVSAGSNR
jgi:ABC-type Co2+ transport system permease subunit